MKFSDPRKIYKIAAIAILSAAVLISGYFVYLGQQKKSESTAVNTPKSSQNNSTGGSGNSSTSPETSSAESYKIVISKINVTAPIEINVDGNNKEEYNKSLEEGVAQLKGSALPGKSGNSFIFGHSSYYADKPGNYKEVFAKLNDLITGDIIEVQATDARYVYKIMDKKVVDPTDVSVAAQNNALKQITLMTCWPVGTTKQRLVVIGELTE